MLADAAPATPGIAKVASHVLAFWFIAICLTMGCKSVFTGDMKLPFPIGLSGLCFAIEWFIADALLRRRERGEKGAPRQHFEWRARAKLFLPIGIASGLQVGFSNLALLSLAVSLQTMVRSATPVAVLLISFAAGLQRPRPALVTVVLVVSFGTGLITYGVRPDAEFAWHGFAAILFSMLCGGTRLCLSQVLLQGRTGPPIDKLTLLYHMLPVCCAAVVPSFFLLEYAKFTAYWAAQPSALATLLRIATVAGVWACLGFCLVFVELSIIGMTSSLTFSICATCKELLLVAIATWVNAEVLSPLNLLGFCISLSGVVAYKVMKYREVVAQRAGAGAAQQAKAAAAQGGDLEMAGLLAGAEAAELEDVGDFVPGGGGGGAGAALGATDVGGGGGGGGGGGAMTAEQGLVQASSFFDDEEEEEEEDGGGDADEDQLELSESDDEGAIDTTLPRPTFSDEDEDEDEEEDEGGEGVGAGAGVAAGVPEGTLGDAAAIGAALAQSSAAALAQSFLDGDSDSDDDEVDFDNMAGPTFEDEESEGVDGSGGAVTYTEDSDWS